MTAVQHDVVFAPVGQRIGRNQCGSVVCGGISLATETKRFPRPLQRQVWKCARDPFVAAGMAKQDQVARSNVARRYVDVVFDRQLAAKVMMPFVGESAQARVGILLYVGVPRLAGASHTQERRGEGIIDWTLQAGTLAGSFCGVAFVHDSPCTIDTCQLDSTVR